MFPDPQTSNAGEDSTSKARRSRRTEIGEGSPVMGSNGNNRLEIAQRNTGSHKEGRGMLWSSQFANAVSVRVSAVVGLGGGLLGFVQMAGSWREEESAVRDCEAGKRPVIAEK